MGRLQLIHTLWLLKQARFTAECGFLPQVQHDPIMLVLMSWQSRHSMSSQAGNACPLILVALLHSNKFAPNVSTASSKSGLTSGRVTSP